MEDFADELIDSVVADLPPVASLYLKQMSFHEGAAGAGFEVCLKLFGRYFGCKGMVMGKLPGWKFVGMGGLARVMLMESMF